MNALARKKLGIFRILNLAWDALVVAAFVLLLTSILSDRGVSLFGARGYIVMSGSMRPSLHEGAYLVSVVKPAESIKAGDIVTYRADLGTAMVSHRVVEVLGSGGRFITKGDANKERDPNPVAASRVQGVALFWINGVGAFMLFLLKPLPFAALMLLMVATLIVPEVIKLRKNKLADNKKGTYVVPPDRE